MAKTKQTRRMIAMALAAAVVMSSMPVVAFAEDGGSQQTDNSGSEGGSGTGSEGGSGTGSEGGSTPAAAPAAETPSYTPPAPTPDETPVVNDDSDDLNITVQIPPTADAEPNTAQGDPVGKVKGDDLPTSAEDDEYDYKIVTGQGSVTVEKTEEDKLETEYGKDNMDYVSGDVLPTEDNDLVNETSGAYDAADGYLPDPNEGDQQVGPAIKPEGPAEGEDWYQYQQVGTGNTSQYIPLTVFEKGMSDEEKVLRYGNKAYINPTLDMDDAKYFNYYTTKWLGAEYCESIKVDGEFQYDAEGYLIDPNNNNARVLKAEQTKVVNGKTYYMHRFDLPFVNTTDWYDEETGEWEKIKNTQLPWSEASQYLLVDKVTGEVMTTYSVEMLPHFSKGGEYRIGNLEDSNEFGDKEAAAIRAIAEAGYWGTTGTETDESGKEVPKAGSLDAMKDMLVKSGNFTAEEVASLTDGMAMTATQMAIYAHAYSKFGVDFVDANYVYDPTATETDQWGNRNVVNVDAATVGKDDEVKLMFKVYEYLKGMGQAAADSAEKKAPTTEDTIITAENFLKEGMEITVLGKAEDHENNKDDNTGNDAYVTSVSFALVVTPSTENGDKLVVKVISGNEVLGEAVIAGEGAIDADEKGNYTIGGIVLTEGNQNINITMEGVQNLKEGVYLFTADVEQEFKDGLPSNDMVGIAGGEHSVKVTQNMSFNFDVEDEQVVVRKRSSRVGSKKPTTTTIPEEEVPMIEQPEIIPEEEVPMTDLPGFDFDEDPAVEDIEIGDEEVPMADAPVAEDSVIAETGDSNHMTAGFGGMFAALAGMMMLKRRKEN